MRYRSTSIKLLWGKFGLAPKPNRSGVTVYDVGVRNCSRNGAPLTRKTAIAAFLRLGLSDGTPCGSPARANHFRFSGDCSDCHMAAGIILLVSAGIGIVVASQIVVVLGYAG